MNLQEKMPPDGPELEGQRELRKTYDNEWPAAYSIITGSTLLEPVAIDICGKTEDVGPLETKAEDEILKEASTQLERKQICTMDFH